MDPGKLKKPFPKKAIVDKFIELTDNELRASREKYDEEQARLAKEIRHKALDREAYYNVQQVS